MTDIADSQPQAAADALLAASLQLVTGYDGSPPATRALGAAATLLRGRPGSIDVVYVAHVPSVDMMSANALAEVEAGFGDVEKELRASAAAQLEGRGVAWEFQRRDGLIAAELIAAASVIGDADPSASVAIVVGSSSRGSHRVVGSTAVALARRCPVPLVIVPLGRRASATRLPFYPGCPQSRNPTRRIIIKLMTRGAPRTGRAADSPAGRR